MKTIAFVFVLLVTASNTVLAQCGKNIILVSSKTEFLDNAGVVQKTDMEKSTIEITKTEITVTPGNEATASGKIKSDTCNWKIPFREGKTIIKADMVDEGGDTKNVTFTIQGKDGNIIVLVEVEGMENRKIRLTVDTFQAKK